MIQPIIHDYLTQIFVKHYGHTPDDGAEAALKFMDILELYDMKLIIGDWVVPEVITIHKGPATIWEQMAASISDIEESGREPWLSKEIQ